METSSARVFVSFRSVARGAGHAPACLQRLLFVTTLLLVASAGRIAGADARLLAWGGMDYALAMSITAVCAVAALLVVFDEAGRAQRTRHRLRRASVYWLQREQRRCFQVVTRILARVVRRRVRLHATLPPPQAAVAGRPIPFLPLCKRLQRGQRPRVPAAGGCFLGCC